MKISKNLLIICLLIPLININIGMSTNQGSDETFQDLEREEGPISSGFKALEPINGQPESLIGKDIMNSYSEIKNNFVSDPYKTERMDDYSVTSPIKSLFSTPDIQSTSKVNSWPIEKNALFSISNLNNYANHDPILIDGNADFATQNITEGWIGDGTEGNPYFIKDIFINSSITDGISISNTDVFFRIENVWVNGSTDNGIILFNVTNAKIISNFATDNGESGFYIQSSENNSFLNNTATDNGYIGFGILASDSSTFSDNTAINNEYGFTYFRGQYNNLTGNIAFNNDVQGFEIQGDYYTLNSNYASNNGFLASNPYPNNGFYLGSLAYKSTLINNTATQNAGSGFRLSGCEYNNLTGNTATDNGEVGFILESNSNNILTDNTASNNSKGGFNLDNSDSNILINNTATNNTGIGSSWGMGFGLVWSDQNLLINNIAINNDREGFFIVENYDSPNTFINNKAINNGFRTTSLTIKMGFRISNSISPTLINNTATNNAGSGFVFRINYGNLTFNTAIDNGEHGFSFDNSYDNSFVNNTATDNGENGFHIENSEHNSFINNTATDNGFSGFYLFYSDYNTLSDNTATNNEYGFVSGLGQYNNLTGNIAFNNIFWGMSITDDYNTLNSNYASNNGFLGFRLMGNYMTIINNTATSNAGSGFYVQENFHTLINNTAKKNNLFGYYFENSDFNILTENIASFNSDGFLFNNSNSNILTRNYLTDQTSFGVKLIGISVNNMIYTNFFIDNNGGGIQANDSTTISPNYWTNGTHGNYWSDYTGYDADFDGRGEEYYSLAGSNAINDTEPLVSILSLIPSTTTFEIEGGSTGNTISWLVTSNFSPQSYSLYVDNQLSRTGTWTSGSSIVFDTDVFGSVLDSYNITLVVSDNWWSTTQFANTINLTVVDSTDPVITDITVCYSGECNDVVGNTVIFNVTDSNNNISMAMTDLYPDFYDFLVNGSSYLTDSWISGVTESISLNFLEPGIYNITLISYDTSGNIVVKSIITTIIDTTAPVITNFMACSSGVCNTVASNSIFLDVRASDNNISIVLDDVYPSSIDLLINGSSMLSDTWNSDITISIPLDMLVTGVYNLTFIVTDTSENFVIRTLIVTVDVPVTTTYPTTTISTTGTETSTNSTSTGSSDNQDLPLIVGIFALGGGLAVGGVILYRKRITKP